jgi:hypothetical protein
VGSCPDLLDALAEVVDPRQHRGIHHRWCRSWRWSRCPPGPESYVAARQGASNAPAEVLDALAVWVHPRIGTFVMPSESTIRRTLQACDGGQLEEVLGAWLYLRLPSDEMPTVDGMTLRGAKAGDGRAVHVLAAMLAGPRTVPSPREIAHKTTRSSRSPRCSTGWT